MVRVQDPMIVASTGARRYEVGNCSFATFGGHEDCSSRCKNVYLLDVVTAFAAIDAHYGYRFYRS